MSREILTVVVLDRAYAVRSDRDGIVSEGHDCRASAEDWILDRQDAELAAEEAERAAAREPDEADVLARAYEAQQAADYAEEVRLLDAIYAATTRLLSSGDPRLANRDAVVRKVLAKLDELGME